MEKYETFFQLSYTHINLTCTPTALNFRSKYYSYIWLLTE